MKNVFGWMSANDWKILELSQRIDAHKFRLRDGMDSTCREGVWMKIRDLQDEIDSLRPADYPPELLYKNQK